MIKGWLFDIYPDERGMALWIIDAEGRRVRLSDPYRPSFFVAGAPNALRHVRKSILTKKLSASFRMTERRDFWMGRDKPVLEVSADCPAFDPAVKHAASVSGVELFNCDIPLAQMYLYEKGLFPLASCEVEQSANGNVSSIHTSDPPSEIDYSLPPLETLKLSVASDGINPNYGGERCNLRMEVGGREYVLEEDELLDTVEDTLVRHDPDLILTEWGDSFILPRLLQMAQARGRSLSLNRDAGRKIGIRKEVSYFSYGQIVYRAPARTLFGRWHIDVKNSFIASETGLEGLFEIARLTRIPIQRLARTSPGTGISSMQLDMAMRDGILIPWHKRMPEDFKSGLDLLTADKGGLVYLPRPGLYEDVMEIDFASMYPAIMVNHNISPETINCSCCEGEPVPEIGYHSCRKRRGLVPRVLEPILWKRRTYKELSRRADDPDLRAVYDRRQTALKWMLVTCFGYLGYKNARFGRIEAHEAVTALGREKLLQAKEIAERRGFELVHAIVDSLWVRKPGMTQAEQGGLLREITEAVGIPIMLEGNYKWIAFVPSKTSPTLAVANRYFGLFDTGQFKMRGIELRRSDVPPIVNRMQKEMLQILSSVATADEFRRKEPELLGVLKEYLAHLKSGDVPARELVISQKLSKNPADYKTNTAMAAASKALIASGKSPKPGERVNLIIVESGARGQAVKAIPYIAGMENVDRYDADKYGELLVRAAETILLRRLKKEDYL
jgi:DNA polymerase-2